MTNLRNEARGRVCQIRIPGVCNHDSATTVLCHMPSRAMGAKSHDFHGAHGCSACHDVVDGRTISDHPRELIKLWFLEAILRTQEALIKEEVVDV